MELKRHTLYRTFGNCWLAVDLDEAFLDFYDETTLQDIFDKSKLSEYEFVAKYNGWCFAFENCDEPLEVKFEKRIQELNVKKRKLAKTMTNIWNEKADFPYGIVWKDGRQWNIVQCESIEHLESEFKALTSSGHYSYYVMKGNDTMTIEDAICTLDRHFPKDGYRYVEEYELVRNMRYYDLAIQYDDTGYKAKVIGGNHSEDFSQERAWQILAAIKFQGFHVYSNKTDICMEATVINGKLSYREMKDDL